MTSNSGSGLAALARLFFDIAIWRRGPQHVPTVGILLPLTLGTYFLINAVLIQLLPPTAASWALQLAGDMAFMLLWYWILLTLCGRRERYRQTITAIFGYQAVLTTPIIVTSSLMQRYGGDSLLQLPVYCAALVMLVWTVVAMAHILRAALECSLFAGLGLALLQLLAEGLLIYALFERGG